MKRTLLIFKIQFLQKPSLFILGELVCGIAVLRHFSQFHNRYTLLHWN